MSLPLPRLDNRNYSDLMEEARALIPALCPEWTDHNPADPGVTLVELFAWLTEMLIYRVDQVTDEQVRAFLKLLNGSEWQPGPDLEEDVRQTVTALSQRYRAVTAEDYEELALEASPQVARAWCVPRRNLAAADEAIRAAEAPGHVSVILMPDATAVEAGSPAGAPLPTASLLDAVTQYLEPRRLLATRNHVVGPTYAPVGAEVLLSRLPGTDPAALADAVREALTAFLDPLAGGPRGDGWKLGRDVYVSELYELLESVPGVDQVADVALESVCPQGAPSCRPAAVLWHDSGDLVGLGLEAHHLPWARFDAAAVVAAETLVSFRVTVEVSPATSAAEAAREVKQEVRRLFHPLHQGPDGTEDRTVSSFEVRAALEPLAAVAAVGGIDFSGDSVEPAMVTIGRGEMAAAETVVELI